MANNFWGMVFGALKEAGIEAKDKDDAYKKFQELQKKNGKGGTHAEEKRVKELTGEKPKAEKPQTTASLKKEAINNNDIKTISKEEKERLKNGVLSGQISIEELKSLPLVQNAEKDAFIPDENQTHHINTPERMKLREQVKEKLLNMGSFNGKEGGKETFGGEVKQERIAHIVIGPPAGGKSSVFANPLSQELKARIIDSDEAKKLLPEFEGGLGAGKVHEESSDIANGMVLPEAIKRGDNIVLPIVGKTQNSVEKHLKALKEGGYKVYLDLNEVGADASQQRAFLRFLNTGRFLSFNYLQSIGNKPLDTYNYYKQNGGFDGYAHFNNEVKMGEKPRKIEQTYVFKF